MHEYDLQSNEKENESEVTQQHPEVSPSGSTLRDDPRRQALIRRRLATRRSLAADTQQPDGLGAPGSPEAVASKGAAAASPAVGDTMEPVSPGATSGGTGGSSTPAVGGSLKPFHDGLAAKDQAKVELAWSMLSAADRKNVTASDVLAAFDVAPEVALQMMKTIGADFSSTTYATKLLSVPKPELLVPALVSNGLWDSFIKSSPNHQELNKAQRNALGRLVKGSNARPVFEKAYPKLHDATYAASFLKTAPWGDADIERLYHAFDGLPVQHVQASSGGFFLGTDHNLSGSGFVPLGFAWQQGDKMVLPKNSSTPNGGGTGHDMTGGTRSGATHDVAGTPGGGPTQSHFVGSATHEVGHAVSNKVGGDAWSMTRNGFASMAFDAWSKALFDDAAVQKAIDADIAAGKLAKMDALKAAEVRIYLANAIQKKVVLPTGWSEIKAAPFILKYCSSQPLYAYLDAAQKTGDDYHFPSTNIVGGKTYAYLSRFGNQTCTYNEETYNNRVSWYSISSPAEWFAENYSHYYRMSGKHPVADVKVYFDGLDKYKWTPSVSGSGSLAPSGQPSGGTETADVGTGGASQKGDGAPDGAGPGAAKDHDAHATANIRRLPFSW